MAKEAETVEEKAKKSSSYSIQKEEQ